MASFLFIFMMYYVHGASIPITNSGFEGDNPNAPDNSYWYLDTPPIGWSYWSDGLEYYEEYVGITNPTGGDSFNDPTYGDTAPEGNCVGFTDIVTSTEGDGPWGLYQTLTGYTLTADVTYQLTAFVGNSADNCYDTSTDGKNQCTQKLSGFPGYRLQLLANGAVVAEDANTLSIPEAQWRLSTVLFTPSPSHGQLGQTLGVRLLHPNDISRNSGKEIEWDDIQLNTLIPTTAAPTRTTTKTPTGNPTAAPTKYPTKTTTNPPTGAGSDYPTFGPTHGPSNQPTQSPTHIPTEQPSVAPSRSPSRFPTIGPSHSPTDLPTVAGTLQCGDQRSGTYSGQPAVFFISLPFSGADVTFDATNSDIAISNIDVFTGGGASLIGTDTDSDITVPNLPVGNYKFIMASTAASGAFNVRVTCASNSPTPLPSRMPTLGPSVTRAPTNDPSASPSHDDDEQEVHENQLTVVYIVKVEVCEYASLENCVFDEGDITSKVGDAFAAFTTTISNVQTVDDTVFMDLKIKTNREIILDLSVRDMEDDITNELAPQYPNTVVKVKRKGVDDDDDDDAETMGFVAQYQLQLIVGAGIGLVLFIGCVWWLCRGNERRKLSQHVEEFNRMDSLGRQSTVGEGETEVTEGETVGGGEADVAASSEPVLSTPQPPPDEEQHPSAQEVILHAQHPNMVLMNEKMLENQGSVENVVPGAHHITCENFDIIGPALPPDNGLVGDAGNVELEEEAEEEEREEEEESDNDDLYQNVITIQ